jgi:hypothetical protein
MPLIIPANTLSTGGYEVANSCRFNRGDQPNLSRTLGTPTNSKIWTFSFWYKRNPGTSQMVINSGSSASYMYFVSDLFSIEQYVSSQEYLLKTARVFRDPSAWYHIVVAMDTTQGTDTNRLKLYVNGTQETVFTTATYPAQDLVTNFNSAVAHVISLGGTNALDGYLAEVCLIDGTAYAASDFGEFDEDSPTIWKPKDVSGLTFGNNGFYFDFEDSSNLGNDANGGTDWTVANLAATDQTTDTPTNNFCTFNPLYFRPGRTATTFSEGNCKSVHSDTGGTTPAWGTIALHHGKWYFEMKVIEEYAMYIGIWQTQGAWTNPGLYDGLSGVNTYRPWDGQTNDENVGLASYGDTYADDDIIGCAFDCDTGTIWFSKNGTWQNSATQAEVVAGTTTNAAFTGKAYSTNGVIPICTAYSPSPSSGASVEANFGNPSFTISSGNADDNGYGNFEYDVPTGYYAICTKNLAEFG